MILMIDNYDSFVYNLVRYFIELGHDIKVYRNDALTVQEIRALAPTHIVISPGPCTPNEAGISLQVIQEFGGHIPILGVCLGHQAIGQVFGGVVKRAAQPVHGKTSLIQHNGQGLFKGLPQPLTVTRYHSLIVERESLPQELEITAETEEGEIMAFAHKTLSISGVQFHPEAVLTEGGHALLQNFLEGDR